MDTAYAEVFEKHRHAFVPELVAIGYDHQKAEQISEMLAGVVTRAGPPVFWRGFLVGALAAVGICFLIAVIVG